ncbi:hypothetical protein Q5P01_009395 [Channa striata]|uniref:Uncharacterized protein n=1 Tax=Channa striata TaxID=64152 RepID=A0AA88N139_CHASR|nr:hypothetical protein Q5P01_009395 [Channa striata]
MQMKFEAKEKMKEQIPTKEGRDGETPEEAEEEDEKEEGKVVRELIHFPHGRGHFRPKRDTDTDRNYSDEEPEETTEVLLKRAQPPQAALMKPEPNLTLQLTPRRGHAVPTTARAQSTAFTRHKKL